MRIMGRENSFNWKYIFLTYLNKNGIFRVFGLSSWKNKTTKKKKTCCEIDLETIWLSTIESLMVDFYFFCVPNATKNMLKPIFERKCAKCNVPHNSGLALTKAWQCLTIAILAGCTASHVAFTMTMEVIIMASKWLVVRKRQLKPSQISILHWLY